MATGKRFLARGFFPKEVPPAFRSATYADALESVRFAPPAFTSLPVKRSALSPHSLGRAGGVRRNLSIPNPVFYARLANEMASGWGELSAHFRGNAASRPHLRGAMGRAASPSARFAELPLLRAQNRRHGRYVLLADIAEYYRTLYTHSIPWALHTKATVRIPANMQSTAFLGNRLDTAVRNCQEGQTNGVPVGPDTSFVIGEIILSAIDGQIAHHIQALSTLRFYDDFELVFERYSEAESALAALHGILAEFSLQLNAVKTVIVPLPLRLDHSWRDPIRKYVFGITDAEVKKNLVGFFDLAVSLKAEYPQDAVVGYAISRLESVAFGAASWRLAESLLLQALSIEPNSLHQVAAVLAKAHVDQLPISTDDLGQALELVVGHHAAQGHGSEVAWALWIALSFKCKLTDPGALAALARMPDSVVALLALDANARGFLPGLDLTYWQSLMTLDQLYDAHWMLSYEARNREWLGTVGGGDHVHADPAYRFLRQNRVQFYSRVRAPTRVSLKAIHDWRPQYSS